MGSLEESREETGLSSRPQWNGFLWRSYFFCLVFLIFALIFFFVPLARLRQFLHARHLGSSFPVVSWDETLSAGQGSRSSTHYDHPPNGCPGLLPDFLEFLGTLLQLPRETDSTSKGGRGRRGKASLGAQNPRLPSDLQWPPSATEPLGT